MNNDGKKRLPKLKECPFCGSRDVSVRLDKSNEDFWTVYVMCEMCGCEMKPVPMHVDYMRDCSEVEALLYDIEVATSNWNMRTVDDAKGYEGGR